MRILKSLSLAFTVAAAVSGAASAQTLVQPTAPAPKAAASKAGTTAPSAAAPKTKPEPKLNYLSPDAFAHPGLLLPPPLSPDSAEGRADLAAVKAAQAAATPDHIVKAAADDGNETVWAFADVLQGLDKAKLPLTDKLFTAAQNDEDSEASVAKVFFARRRPFDVDHTVKTCVPSTYDGAPRSYPSGHATMGYSLGIVLAQLVPEKADVILARARAYAENRVICGVHFPSDLAASQALGTAVAVEFTHSTAFKKDFDAAKAELVAAGVAATSTAMNK